MRILKARFRLAFLPVSLWIIATSGWALHDTTVKFALLTFVVQSMLLLFYINVMPQRLSGRKGRVLRWTLNSIAVLYILLQLITLEYYLVQGFPLDPFFALDSYSEVLPTIFQTFHILVLITGVVLTSGACWLCSWGLIRFKRRFGKQKGRVAVLLWAVPLVMLVVLLDQTQMSFIKLTLPLIHSSRAGEEINDGLPPELIGQMKNDVGAITRQFGEFHSESGESVFILQLESVNALAVNGAATREGGGPERFMPMMYGAHKQGVIAPHMWGATMQTHRGQGSILCSSILDRYAGVTNARQTPKGCLPQKLKDDGYYTFFASAYPEPEFAHTFRFMQDIGFDDLHFADRMHEGDAQHAWGYDDCIFFSRYFDYMDRHHEELMKSRFLGYFEVSGNHNTFSRKGLYSQFEPFKGSNLTFVQRYLDSAAAQDHCIGTFLRRVQPYREHAHVIIVADHSWPVGINGSQASEQGATSDNFMIPFLYLPPLDRETAHEYRHNTIINKPILYQADIFPTILELLSGKSYENSFAPLLKNTADGTPPQLPDDYDDCQVMTQPYDGTQVVVAHGKELVQFNLTTHKLTWHRLYSNFTESDDIRDRSLSSFGPKRLQNKRSMTFGQFLNEYLCKRYRYWEPTEPGQSKAVPVLTEKWVF